jgi:DNA repair protein RadC
MTLASAITIDNLQQASDSQLLQHMLGDCGLTAINSLANAFGLQQSCTDIKIDKALQLRLLCARALLARALSESFKGKQCLDSPEEVKTWLRLQLGGLCYESFWTLWLDARLQLLHAEEMFRGTLAQTTVYPRELARRGLHLNAAAVVLVHNHPSGESTASKADVELTQRVKDALRLVDIRVIDHLIVAGPYVQSMAEQGVHF